MDTFMGLPIFVSPFVQGEPKLRVRESVPMTDAYRAEINDWLLDLFGRHEVGILMAVDRIFVNAAGLAAIRNHAQQ